MGQPARKYGVIAEGGSRRGERQRDGDRPLIMSALIKARSAALGAAYQILIFTAGRRLGAPTTAIYPGPSPNDGHPSASDRASNASDGVRRVAAAVSRAEAAALGEEVAHGRQWEKP